MSYEIEVHEFPTLMSAKMFSCRQALIDAIKKSKIVEVYARKCTKTTIYVELKSGENCLLVNYIPSGCEEMKFHTTKEFSVFHGERAVSYFKVSKTQKAEEFRKYIVAVLDDILQGHIEDLKIEIYLDEESRRDLGI